MKQVKKFLKMVNPFNNMEEMPTAIFITKKILAFIFIYLVAGILGEAIVIAGLTVAGYDPLHGVMPEQNISILIPYYVFIVFALVTFIYCRIVEKRSPKALGFNGKIYDYIAGLIIAVVLLAVIMLVCSAFGGITYTGINKNINWLYIIALLGGLVIQGAAEETLCRGFLMTALSRKVPEWLTVICTATAFAVPHFSTIFESDLQYAIIGVINLYLVSVVFSLLVLIRSNVWVACGLHTIWNFLLYGVFGLNLSGSEADVSGILSFKTEGTNIINGGQYGIEASIITTVVLGMAVIILCYVRKKITFRRVADGV